MTRYDSYDTLGAVLSTLCGSSGRWSYALAGPLALVAACGGTPPANDAGPAPGGDAAFIDDGSSPRAGTATLEGAQAFPAGAVLMVFVTGGCSQNGDAGAGVHAALQIAIVQAGPASATACSSAAATQDGGSGYVVEIGIATTQFAAFSGAPLTDSLTPGTYAISNEGENDEDFCMLRGGGSAFLLVGQLYGESQSIASSGTVTINSIGAASVTGTFSVTMGGLFGAVDAGALSGAFEAVAACP